MVRNGSYQGEKVLNDLLKKFFGIIQIVNCKKKYPKHLFTYSFKNALDLRLSSRTMYLVI